MFLSTHAPFDQASIEAISAVGTISLAIQYILPASIMLVSPHISLTPTALTLEISDATLR